MKTPIIDFIKEYSGKKTLRLHMPGHKGKGFFGVEKFDITEIDGADVLYACDGIIAQSEKNAAALFETENTFYSTEGSSLVIRAMMYLVKIFAVAEGKRAFVAAGRNAHKTFINACALLGIDVDWLMPENGEGVLSCVIDADFLDNYLKTAGTKPTVIYITSPDYLGNITDIKAISRVCRKYGVLLFVDNAHGAYLKFLNTDIHPIMLGADVCCDSAHKTLPVLTGGAYLHISKYAPRFFLQNAQRSLSLFASTSPSYLILQSLDNANAVIADGFSQKVCQTAEKLDCLKEKLMQCGYALIGDEPLKLTLNCKKYGYTGTELAEILAKNSIVCEFYDPDVLVMMFTPEIPAVGFEKVKKVLTSIPQKEPVLSRPPKLLPKIKCLSPKDALFSSGEWIDAADSQGRISAMTDFACPPAVPVCILGEKIDENTVEFFKYYGIKKCYVVK